MRKIERIFVHCSAGNQSNTAKEIVDYHLRPTSRGGRGWKNPGYHYIIEADGKIVNTHPEEKVSNGVYGYNSTAINVCYVGGVDTSKPGLPPLDNRTPAQKASLLSLLRMLKKKYPEAKIHGHRDFAAKACPSFDATKEYAGL
ncbi:MAG: N-acetylmuramoyl-L-alanine amidase [Duncaniella sp.]|nr:N-acetylmuramoyl-L-alanine amidase [Duncaniella sp.]